MLVPYLERCTLGLQEVDVVKTKDPEEESFCFCAFQFCMHQKAEHSQYLLLLPVLSLSL